MRLASAVALAAVVAASTGCRDTPPAPRLVVLFAPCTVNRDALAPYGAGVRYTPNLAAFARESVVFLRHQTETDQSGPAYAALFSGAQVDRHKVYRHPARLGDELYLVAEAFADRGYETHFWSGHPMASAELNYGQGVPPERTHHRKPGVADLYGLTGNDAEFASILARLRQEPEARAFVQVNFTITHAPYFPVDPRAVADFRREYPEAWPALSDQEVDRWARVYAADYLRWQWDFANLARDRGYSADELKHLAAVVRAFYQVSVRLLDHCFGRLVNAIRAAGLLNQSVIVFTADHGETLERESALFKWTHGAEITPESIEIPLMIRLPGEAPRAGIYQGVSRSIDVYPTIAGLAGIAARPSSGVDGVDLSQALLGRHPPPELRAFSHTTLLGNELVGQFKGWQVARYHPSTDAEHMWVSVREADQYARLRRLEDGAWGFDVFDLAPRPLRAPAHLDATSRRQRELTRELEGYKARLVSLYAQGGAARALQEAEARERLRALGYIQ
jgi:arylsulfatase A-like enzyme